MKLSVIVPVYNVEPYLRRCIDSILAQTFTDFELILVDDGSPDGCGSMCDWYIQKCKNVTVVHTINMGQAAARNHGLDIATGDYIMFCDSDDCYDSEELCELLDWIVTHQNNSSTVIAFNFKNVWLQTGVENMQPYSPCDVMISNPVDFLSNAESHQKMGYAVWNKVYSKEMIDKYHLRILERDAFHHKDDWAEDLSFNLQYFMHVNRLVVTEFSPYLHGTKEQQNEEELRNRIGHITDFLYTVYSSENINDTQKSDFWKIAIWHLRRYFYIDTASFGVEETRKHFYESEHKDLLISWAKAALRNWSDYGMRWEEPHRSDYRFLLQYLVSGNMTIYKVNNYLLWKVKKW